MALFSLRNRKAPDPAAGGMGLAPVLQDFSIEVMPRTADTIGDLRGLLPAGTRVYIAHIDGTPIDAMVATARRLARDGFAVMPHLPARIIKDRATLADWINRYQGEAGVDQALLIAGGLAAPRGDFQSSMQVLETGLLRDFRHLHVAGHPEGNRDIDPDGSDTNVMDALRWKQRFSETSAAQMALVTQFTFDAAPVIAWADSLRAVGITLPVHVGIAGPARLQTLIKFALACGVGPSLQVLQKRATDVTKLLLPYTPTALVSALAAHKAAHPHSTIAGVHLFPLGGIKASADWAAEHSTPARMEHRT